MVIFSGPSLGVMFVNCPVILRPSCIDVSIMELLIAILSRCHSLTLEIAIVYQHVCYDLVREVIRCWCTHNHIEMCTDN